MTSLNYKQWHEWTLNIQNEHSKLNNTECCICYSYCVLNKNVCGKCSNYVCNECSHKLANNICPVCRTEGIVVNQRSMHTSVFEEIEVQGFVFYDQLYYRDDDINVYIKREPNVNSAIIVGEWNDERNSIILFQFPRGGRRTKIRRVNY